MRLPLYAAGLATGGAFGNLFSGGALLYVLGAAFVGIIVGSAGAYRFVLLFPAAFLYTLVAVYGALPLRLSDWGTLLKRAGQDIHEAAQISYVTPVPYDLHPGLLVVLIPVIVLVVAFATSVTLYEGSPIVSVAVLGLTIGVLSTVSFEVGVAPFFALFLVSGVALLLFARDGGVGRGGRARPAAVLAGALVLLLVLALPQTPLAEEAIRPALIDWTRIGTGGTSRLAVEADVGDYLTEGRDAELLRIRSTEPMLWRGGTLDHFDGVRWSSTVESGEDDGEEISAGVETHEVEQAVEVLEAETNLLFGGYRISRVSVPNADERSDGSWASDLPLVQNSSYRVRSQIPQPTTYQLEAAGAGYTEAVREKFLQLPDDKPEVLSETAQNIQTYYGPQTPYDTARAIERYLLYDGGFTYDLDADYGRGDRAIEEFLGENRRGFCTQFATSMALLSRELGVPSRVVYGATTGKRVAPDEYVVTGYNMHTWVEVYFPGVGWYPFDPTPGFSVPRVMEANAPRPNAPGELSYVSSEAPSLERLQAPGPAPGAEGSPVDAESVEPAEVSSAWPRYAIPAILVLVLLAAVLLLKRLLTARGLPEDLYRDLAGRLRDVLPLSGANTIVDSPALTPTERLVLLASTAGIEAGPFREFAQAYSESLYASHEPRSNASRAYRRALREYESLPRWKRALGAVNPASLFLRARRRLAAHKLRLWKALHSRIEGLKRFRGER
ncbi:MAG: transglutaminaseTgpA domain-containing protein [Actinomycetota bacterium]|nr:transglutaminaseTgpA domain-containing protein [Actinomycetota bacterium]